MIKCIIISIAALILGFWAGLELSPEKEVRIDYLDMAELTEQKVEVVASIFGKILQDKGNEEKMMENFRKNEKLLKDTHLKNMKELEEFKQLIEGRRHTIWQGGYIEGYRIGRTR